MHLCFVEGVLWYLINAWIDALELPKKMGERKERKDWARGEVRISLVRTFIWDFRNNTKCNGNKRVTKELRVGKMG